MNPKTENAVTIDAKPLLLRITVEDSSGKESANTKNLDLYFLKYALGGFTGKIELVGSVASSRYSQLLQKMQAEKLLSNLQIIDNPNLADHNLVSTSSDFRTVTVSIKASTDSTTLKIHDSEPSTEPNSIESWRDVQDYLWKKHSAYTSDGPGQYSQIILNKPIRPLDRPIATSHHPWLAEYISLAEAFKRQFVVSLMQEVISKSDKQTNFDDLRMTAVKKIILLEQELGRIQDLVGQIALHIDSSKVLPQRSNTDPLGNFLITLKTQAADYAAELNLLEISRILQNELSQQPVANGHKTPPMAAQWSNITWGECCELSEILSYHARNPSDPLVPYFGLSLKKITPENLRDEALQGSRFLILKNAEGGNIGAVVMRPRHKASEVRASKFLRQIDREGSSTWGYFVALAPDAPRDSFRKLDLFMELAALVEGNKKILAVVHPANIVSMANQLRASAKILPICDFANAAVGYLSDQAQLPENGPTQFVVFSRNIGNEPQQNQGSEYSKLAFKLYCGEMPGLFELEKWGTFVEIYQRINLQIKFLTELRTIHSQAQEEHSLIAFKVRELFPDADFLKLIDDHRLTKKIPTPKLIEEILPALESRKLELIDQLTKKYPRNCNKILIALENPTPELFSEQYQAGLS